MFKSHFIRGNLEEKAYFKKYSNNLTKVKALAKKNPFANKLKNHQGDPKNMGHAAFIASTNKEKRQNVRQICLTLVIALLTLLIKLVFSTNFSAQLAKI